MHCNKIIKKSEIIEKIVNEMKYFVSENKFKNNIIMTNSKYFTKMWKNVEKLANTDKF